MVAPTIKLNSGHEMPIVGFGLWKVDNKTCADTVYNAIKTGYRLFDGALDYGNEKESGEGVRRAIDEGLVKREDLFITSKLWNSQHEPSVVKKTCQRQLELWGLDYFDLYLIHFPVALEYVEPETRWPSGWLASDNKTFKQINVPLHETWHAMEELVDAGLAKSIGVSNYSGSLMIDLTRYAKIQPAALQIELHPYNVQKHLVNFCQKKGIAVTAYSSFGPMSYVELGLGTGVAPLLEHDTIKSIASKLNKGPAQILLRWSTQKGIAVIPKSNNQKRLANNLDVCSFDIPEEDVKKVDALDQRLRFNDPTTYGFEDLVIFH